MVFNDWQSVLNGTKTQTRRPKLEGQSLVIQDGSKSVVGLNGRTKWQVGKAYSIRSGRGKAGKGRFRLVDIREERVAGISCEDCLAEGVIVRRSEWGPIWFWGGRGEWLASREAFRELWDSTWLRRPDLQWVNNPLVWVLVMEVA